MWCTLRSRRPIDDRALAVQLKLEEVRFPESSFFQVFRPRNHNLRLSLASAGRAWRGLSVRGKACECF